MTEGSLVKKESFVFLSDSHFTVQDEPWATGVTSSDGPAHAHEFRSFLEHLSARRPEDRPQSVVLLGDWLDFSDSAERAAVRGIWSGVDEGTRASETLQWITEANRAVFEGLKHCLGAGISVEVVVGNHDMDLTRQGVQEQLRAQANPRVLGSASLNFHPWLFHVPGLVYAEHGHQHQAINHIPTMLHPYELEETQQMYRTLSTVLGEYRHRQRDPEGLDRVRTVLENAGCLYQLCTGVVDQVNSRRREEIARYQQQCLPQYARAIGLDPRAVQDIDTVSRFRVAALIAAASRQVGNRLFGTSTDYLAEAGRRIDQLLRAADCSVPFYIFGHSHQASRRPLATSADASQYFNTGTWSPYTRGSHPPAEGTRMELTYVVVRRSAASESSADLCRWSYGL